MPQQQAVLFNEFTHGVYMARTAEAGAFATLFKQDDGRKAAHAIMSRQFHVFPIIHLDLRQMQTAAEFLHDALQHR